MIDEQVKDLDVTPERADGTTDGSDGPAQQQQSTQVQQAEPADSDLRSELASLKQQLADINRGYGSGQLRNLQSEIAALKQQLGQNSQTKNQSQTDFLGKYTPEQIAESEALIEALWKKKFGSDWERLQAEHKEGQHEKIANTFESSARSYAGNDYDKLDPLMTRITDAAYQAAQNGDSDAAEFVKVMTQFPKSGARQLVAMAKELYADSVQGKSSQAGAAQQQKGAAAASKTPGGVQRQSGKPDPKTMPIEDLRAAVEAELGNA